MLFHALRCTWRIRANLILLRRESVMVTEVTVESFLVIHQADDDPNIEVYFMVNDIEL